MSSTQLTEPVHPIDTPVDLQMTMQTVPAYTLETGKVRGKLSHVAMTGSESEGAQGSSLER